MSPLDIFFTDLNLTLVKDLTQMIYSKMSMANILALSVML